MSFTVPLPPPAAHSFIIGPAVIHTTPNLIGCPSQHRGRPESSSSGARTETCRLSPYRREGTKSGVRVQARKATVSWHGYRTRFTESKTRSWQTVRAAPGPSNGGLFSILRGRLKQDARGRCATILSIRQTPLCVRLRSRRCLRVLLDQEGPEHGRGGAVEVAARSVQSENRRIIPETG
jgi:hypothetical protein